MPWNTPPTFTAAERITANDQQSLVDDISLLFPTGSYIFVHATPNRVEHLINGGWLECNGASVSTTTYSNLFTLIGYTFGGSGASFTLPDFAGRIAVVAASAPGNTDVTAWNSNEGAVLASRRPKHNHAVTDPGHSHTLSPASTTTSNPGDHSHTYTLPNAGATMPSGPDGVLETGTTTGSFASNGDPEHSVTGSSFSSDVTGVSIVNPSTAPTDAPAYLVGCIVCIKT